MASTIQIKKTPADLANAGPSAMPAATYVINAGNLQLDCQRRHALVNDKNIALAPVEVSLLRCLLEAKGRIVTRTLLFQKIPNPGRARPPKLQSMDVHIKRLRRKLGIAGHSIVTVRNVGYRFEICQEWINQDNEL